MYRPTPSLAIARCRRLLLEADGTVPPSLLIRCVSCKARHAISISRPQRAPICEYLPNMLLTGPVCSDFRVAPRVVAGRVVHSGTTRAALRCYFALIHCPEREVLRMHVCGSTLDAYGLFFRSSTTRFALCSVRGSVPLATTVTRLGLKPRRAF